MEKLVLDNGIKLIYEYNPGNLTSFSIGFDAGAFREDEFPKGTAHALEHILFKGTRYRSEKEINRELDEIFAFNNAMTNYPYVIYYGTCLKEDTEKAFSLYSEIISLPSFAIEGFKEEIDVIIQESKEWGEDLEQRVEDELLANGFDERRLKKIIIGDEKDIRSVTIEDLKSFYSKYYVRNNCIVSVVTPYSKDSIVQLIKNTLQHLPQGESVANILLVEKLKSGIKETRIDGINGTKILLISDISGLSKRELQCLYLFNEAFGEGVSSPLYNKIRTEKGLAYEVTSRIKYEKGIELYSIYVGTSKEKKDDVVSILREIILNKDKVIDGEEHLKILKRRIAMKKYRMEESSIQRAVNLCRENIMFDDELLDINEIHSISYDEVRSVVEKVLNQYFIQVLK